MGLVEQSVKTHDWDRFCTHVDTERLLSQGFDDTSLHNAKCAINQWIHRNYVVKASSSGGLSEDDDNNNNSFVFRKLKFLTNKT